MVERSGRRRIAHTLHKHRYNVAFIIVGAVLLSIILVQLCYPSDRALPFAMLRGEPAGGRTHTDITADVQRSFESATVTFATKKKSTKTMLSGLGASLNADKMVDELTDYPLWQRLIPFSILVKHPSVSRLDVYFDAKKLEAETNKIGKKLAVAPTNAGIEIKKGNLVITPASVGANVSAKAVNTSVANKQFGFSNTTIRVTSKEIEPKKTDDSIAPIARRAESIIAKKVTLKGEDGKTFTPSKKILATWLTFPVDKAGQYQLTIDESAVRDYVNQINEKIKVDPGVMTVNVVDGEEAGRSGGSVGREVNIEEAVTRLKTAVLSSEPMEILTLAMRDVPSVVVSNRRYTETQKGLQAYVNYVTSTQDVYISLTQLTGSKWHVEARANDSIPSGSTFKLYVAMILFDEMQKGHIKWGDAMLDTDVAGCFERMTVASTNPCAEAWIAQFGRQYMDDFLHSHGFSGGTTFVTNGTAVRTTANDLTNYMTRLYYGTLYGSEYRARLLDSLGRHPYRYGIPTGSSGTVHDKVGFLWDYVHDTAIVERPEGTYILTILTRGQSYGRIAQITRELESIMYP